MSHDRKAFNLFSVKTVLVIAPLQSLFVEVCDVYELTASNEVSLYESDKPLDFAFRERMTRFTKLCLKANSLHIVVIPYRGPSKSLLITTDFMLSVRTF